MISKNENIVPSILTTISAFLSIVGGLLILRTHKQPQFTSSARRLLAFLTIADIATAFGNLTGATRTLFYYCSVGLKPTDFPDDGLCTTQSFITTASSMFSFFWTSVIAIHISLVVHKKIDVTENKTQMILIHGVSWGIPLITTTVALSAGVLGQDRDGGPWCWIKGNKAEDLTDKIIWMLFSGKLWEITTYLLTFFLYANIKFCMWKQRRRFELYGFSDITMTLRNKDELFCYAWLVLYVLRVWGTIRFFLIVIHHHTVEPPENVLLNLQSIGDSGQAFGNYLLYCVIDQGTRTRARMDSLCESHEVSDFSRRHTTM